MKPPVAPLRALFFASGASAMGLELVWMKMFAAGLGHEVPAVLAIVTAFLGGLALGAWALDGRISASADPRRWYARLQFCIAAWAMLATFLIPRLNAWANGLVGAESFALTQGFVSFAVPFLALLPATGAMGATLPAMERWLSRIAPTERALAIVYAWNTAGAMAGTLAAAFLFAPMMGFLATALVFATLNLCGGWIAWRSSPVTPARREVRDVSIPAPMSRARLFVTAFVTGLLGIGFELLGVRLLSQALEDTFYTFAVALAVFLFGTTLGAIAYRRLRDTKPFRSLLAKLLCGLALACLAEACLLERVPACYDALRSWLGDHRGAVFASESAVALLVFLLPTLFMGATFSHVVAGARTHAGGIGRASAMNTLGGALAGMVFGVGLLPAIGAKWSLVALASGYVLLLPTWRGPVWIGLVACLGLAFVLPRDLRLVRIPEGATLRDYRDGVMASVAILESTNGQRSLRVNNRFQMGGTAVALAERRQADIPLLLHPHPARALFLGPGTGITLGATIDHPGLVADGVELVPEVIALMPYFAPENRGVGDSWRGRGAKQERARGATNDRVHLVAADARRFVRAGWESYDVIVADLFHPAQDGAGFLYTREHFAAVRQRLAPGGLFCQWVPLHQLDEPTLRVITRTFLDTFSQANAFLLHFNTDIPALALVGTLDPLELSADWLERRAADPAFRQAMRQAGLDRSIALFGLHLAGPAALAAFAGDAPLNTDDFPRVSFRAPHFASRRDARRDALLLGLLDRFSTEPHTFLRPGPETGALTGRLADFVAARDLYLRGLVIEADGKLSEAIELYLDSTRRSLHFTPAYARLVTIIQVMAAADRNSARKLFDRLEAAQPAQPLGRQMLGPLFPEG